MASKCAISASTGTPARGEVMKKRLLHGFGIALVLASPLWITMQQKPNYFNFALSLIIGILLLILAWQTTPTR